MISQKELQNCRLCELYKTRTYALAGEGDPKAQMFFIAQAPGEKEDKANRMFIGPSGRIFRKLLQSADISLADIYMTNLLKCHLPKNRRPKQKEIEACSDFLRREIAEVEPMLLLPLGYYATKYLFEKYQLKSFTKKEFSGLIGKIFPVDKLKIVPLSHPAALLYHQEYTDNSLALLIKCKALVIPVNYNIDD